MRLLFVATVIGVLATAGVVSASDCSDVPPPSNGDWVVDNVGGNVGGTAVVQCKPNYELQGDPTIICQYDPSGVAGSPPIWQWVQGKAAKCIPLCPAINPPENGKWVNVNGNHIGNTATLECNPGYRLSGNADLICNSINNGLSASYQWVNGEGSCVSVECPFIDPPAHGSWTGVTTSYVGNTAELLCDNGYTYKNNKNLVCTLNPDQHSAQWKWTNQQVGSCVNATCADIKPPNNGEWKQVSLNVHGGTGSLVCNPGYSVVGNPNIYCKMTSRNVAEWSWIDQTQVGSCSKISCPAVTPPAGGKWTGVINGDIGATGSLQCNEGYTLFGDKDIVCTNVVNGGAWKWVNSIGYCVPNPQ